jgi:hypothetical protein
VGVWGVFNPVDALGPPQSIGVGREARKYISGKWRWRGRADTLFQMKFMAKSVRGSVERGCSGVSAPGRGRMERAAQGGDL